MSSSLFWDVMFDSEWKQRRDINLLESEELGLEYSLAGVGKQMQAMRQTIHELQVLVGVMGRMLHEQNALDSTTLRARVEAELRVEAAVPVGERPIPCIVCGKAVLPRNTTITPNGAMCDPCANQ